jgi:purine-binding chemotaxis protein CheW
MSPESTPVRSLAAQLRRSFDDSFARPSLSDRIAQEDFLAIELGDGRYVLRLAEIAHVAPIQSITRFPTPLAQLLGIAGVRGALVPVYDMGAWLGLEAGGAPRWLAVTGAAPLALAFPAIHSYVRVPQGATARADEPQQAASRHLAEILHHDGRAVPVISLPSIVAAIESAVQALPQARVA